MKDLDEIVQLARRAPARTVEPPPFFAQRVTANWLSRSGEDSAPFWERLVLRGAAVAAAVMVISLGSAQLIGDNGDDPETDEAAAEIFSLP